MIELPKNEKHKAERRAYAKEHYRKNKEYYKLKYQEWLKANPDKMSVSQQRWRDSNRALTAARVIRKRYGDKVTPAWADFEAMNVFYDQAVAENKQVDHIVPIKSPFVCGLHCQSNLQVLTQEENLEKRNHLWPEMWS